MVAVPSHPEAEQCSLRSLLHWLSFHLLASERRAEKSHLLGSRSCFAWSYCEVGGVEWLSKWKRRGLLKSWYAILRLRVGDTLRGENPLLQKSVPLVLCFLASSNDSHFPFSQPPPWCFKREAALSSIITHSFCREATVLKGSVLHS